MDHEKCKVLLTVLDAGTLSRAADILGYTVSGISRSLSALEEECGITLLYRERNGVKMTTEGMALLPCFKEYDRISNLLADEINSVKGLHSGNVTVGVAYVNHFRAVTKVIYEFKKIYPGVNVNIVQGTSADLIKGLRDHRIDIVIASKREGDFNYTHIQQVEMCACVPVFHRLVEKGVYPLKCFETDDLIAPYSESETDYAIALKNNKISPNIAHVTSDIYSAYSMVEAGLGVSFLNRLEPECWKGDVFLLPTDPIVKIDVGIMYKEESLGPSADMFREKLEGFFPEHKQLGQDNINGSSAGVLPGDGPPGGI